MTDARFEDGEEAPLRLIAQGAEDLAIMAALVQDAVFAGTDMTFARRQHRFAVLLNRFRWEDKPQAERQGRPFERVRSLMVFDTVLAVRSQGIARGEAETILSLLQVRFVPGAEGAGVVELILAGDGVVALEVEALEVTLTDVSRPYRAISGKAPDHGA